MRPLGSPISKKIASLEARWKTPILAIGWFLIIGTSTLTGLYLTETPADLAQVWLPASAGESGGSSVRHVQMPEEVRGFYMTAHSAASPKIRADLFAYARRNGLNAVVIDVKDGDGLLSFMPQRETLRAHAPEKSTIPDIDAVLTEAGEAGLYRIARVFVFQDPMYVKRFPDEAIHRSGGGVWADYKGVTWVDPASKAAWRYNVEVAKDVYARGFDEIQFDYVRFPSDGNMASVVYLHHDGAKPKHEVIREFFSFMNRELEKKAGIPISFDLFGYVTWYVDYDLGIGQLLVDALPNATAVSAMVYPSHYGDGTLGFDNPAEHPYEIVSDSLMKANKLYATREKQCAEVASGVRSATSALLMPCGVELAQQRPWIQAFDIGATYAADEIDAQIRAVRDRGGGGFLLWNARNVYRDFNLSRSSDAR
ncbi:MAG: putative glycoside hydrolase [Patescibacteria group bacterium]